MVGDEADGLGQLSPQPLGQLVGPVVELLGSTHHPLPGLALTRLPGTSLRTCETVVIEVPERSATSLMVALVVCAIACPILLSKAWD